MFVIIGYVVSLVCIFGVYIFHGGNISVILHALPFETITIVGAAMGAFIANNQMKVIKATVAGLGTCFKGSKYTKARYMELMQVDKKTEGGQIRYVLLERIGKAHIKSVADAQVIETLIATGAA